MKRLLTLLACALLCNACAALPAEERSFAVVLGIVRTGYGWTIHARIPTYQTGGGYATVTGEGRDLPGALAALDAASPMELHLGQLRMIVFSAETARSDALQEALAALSGRRDLRPEAYLAITEADMEPLMEALQPTTGARLSKALDVLAQARIDQGSVIASPLSEVLLMGERQQPVLMNVILDGKEAGLSGGWPIGSDGRATEPLTSAETQLLALMQGRLKRGMLSLQEGAVRLVQADAAAELHAPTLQQASVRLTLRCTASPLTEEALSRSVATACLGVLGRLSGMGCDALGLARQAVIHAGDMAEWHDMAWRDRYRDMDWSVSVGVSDMTE